MRTAVSCSEIPGRFATRRSVLRGALAGAAGLCAATVAPRLTLANVADSQASPSIIHTALSDSLHLFQGAGGNVVAATAADGVLLVDGGLEQYSRALLAAVATACGG